MVYQLSQQVSKHVLLVGFARAGGQHFIPKNRARTLPKKKSLICFSQGNPLSKFLRGRPIFDPFESLLPHAAAQNDLCSFAHLLRSILNAQKQFERVREYAAEDFSM